MQKRGLQYFGNQTDVFVTAMTVIFPRYIMFNWNIAHKQQVS